MLKNLKDKLSGIDIDFQKYFAWFSPSKISSSTLKLFRKNLRGIPPEELHELRQWLTNAQNIQTDDILTSKEKLKLLKELPTSNVIVEFIKSSILILAQDGPIKDRDLLRTMINSAGIFTAGMNLRMAGALYLVRYSLPYLLRSEAGKNLTGFMKKEVEAIDQA